MTAVQREVRQESKLGIRASQLPWIILGLILLALVHVRAGPQAPASDLAQSCREAGRASSRVDNLLNTLSNRPTSDGYITVGALFAQAKGFDCAIAAFDAALHLDAGAWGARYNKGLALISRQEYERAVKELQVAARERPDSFAAHNALGIAYRSLGQVAAATEEFKKALSINPASVDASVNLADIALGEKRNVAAIYYAQQALAKSPPSPFAERLEMDLAVAYSQNQEYEKAAGVFTKVLAADPNSAQLHFDLANTYAHYNEWAKAAAQYQEVLRLQPTNETARLSLAKAYLIPNQVNESLPYARDYLQNQPQDPEGYEIEGEVYRKLGRFGDAVPVLRRAVAMDGKSYEAHYNLGVALARLGETEEGIEQLQEAARLKPQAPEPAYELGLLLSKKGAAEGGQSEFQKFQQAKEESQRFFRADTVEEQGNKAMHEGRWHDAVEAYTEAVCLNPQDAPYHYNLSLAYSKLGDRAGEEAELARAVQLNPGLAKAHNQLGLRYMEEGKTADAEKELKAALEVAPHYAEAESNLGVVYGRQGMNNEAEGLFRKAAEDDPQYAQAFVNLGLTLAGQGRLSEAEQEFQSALKIFPDNASVYTALGMTEAKLGHGKEAVEIFSKVVDLQPASANAHLNLGNAFAARYDLRGALEQFSQAVRLDPRSAEAHYRQGRALYDLDKQAEAGAELAIACTLEPDYPAALHQWAQVERELGNLQKSTELLEREVKLTPNDGSAQSLLGQNLLRLGRTDEAIEHLQLAADPENPQALYSLAQTLEKTGKPEAQEYLARINALENERQLTDRVRRLDNFGLEALRARNWTEATKDLKEALEICGNCRFNADLHRDLGLIYCHKGDIENGRRELEDALKLKPDDADARKAWGILNSLESKPGTEN